MQDKRVVITDFEYPDVSIEKRILEEAGAKVNAHQCRTEEDVIRVVAQANAVINQYAPLSRRVIESLDPTCVALGQYGIGVDTIDVAAATERGIVVINVPSYCEDEVAEHALAMLLALARRLPFYDREMRRSLWDYHTQAPIRRIAGQTLGLVGFGKIARKLREKVHGLSLKVVAHDPFVDAQSMKDLEVEPVDLEELLHSADFISVHVPLSEQTRHLLGEKELNLMKSDAVIVNVSRGPVIDQDALARILAGGGIRAAGLDVFCEEPIGEKHSGRALLNLENVCLSPHVAWYSEESIVELREKLAHDVARVLRGKKPQGFVNPEVAHHQGLE